MGGSQWVNGFHIPHCSTALSGLCGDALTHSGERSHVTPVPSWELRVSLPPPPVLTMCGLHSGLAHRGYSSPVSCFSELLAGLAPPGAQGHSLLLGGLCGEQLMSTWGLSAQHLPCAVTCHCPHPVEQVFHPVATGTLDPRVTLSLSALAPNPHNLQSVP